MDKRPQKTIFIRSKSIKYRIVKDKKRGYLIKMGNNVINGIITEICGSLEIGKSIEIKYKPIYPNNNCGNEITITIKITRIENPNLLAEIASEINEKDRA